MFDSDSLDDEQVRSVVLATRPPQTKEELDLFCRALRFPCESCKGTGMDLRPGTYGEVPCFRCHGEGRTGMHLGRVAVCPGHVAPLDVLWALWSRRYKHLLIMANRGGGKTRMIALVEHLLMHFLQFTISHMGGSEAQAHRGRDYVHQQVSVEPWSEAVATHEPGQTKLAFHNGAKIEWLPSTERQASGGHPEMAVLDEADEVDYDVRERYLKTPMGPRSTMIEASTWYKQEGTISRIRKENPRLPTLMFCLHGDSRVATPEGEIPIRDLVGRRKLWVYTLRDGGLALSPAKCVRLTRRNASVVRVRYTWGFGPNSRQDSLVCTPDHKFLLVTGEWKEAQNLQLKDRLEPFYRRRNDGENRGWVVGRSSSERLNEHRFVYEQIFRPLLYGEVVHHKDDDHWNNQPSNLLAWVDSRHKSHHQRKFAKDMGRESRRIEKLRVARRLVGSPWMSEVNRLRWANATPEQRKLRGRRISRSLKGHTGWDTFRAKRTAEECAVLFKQRAKKGWISRKLRQATVGPTLTERTSGRRGWKTMRQRYVADLIRQMKSAAAQGKSYRIAVSNHKVLSVEDAGHADVYCLSVPDTEVFFANGVAVHNCLFETIQQCEYDCAQMPLDDGTVGKCPLYEMEEPQADGTLRTVILCGGKLARMSDGHILVPDAVANWQRSNPQSRRVEHLCQEPTVGTGARAYWGYSSQVSPVGNVLSFDPLPIPNLPLDWTLDFNLNPMSSFIIQQAPPEYGEEWWILDEIYLYTASTEHVCQEFARRYGIQGTMLSYEARATGHVGGLHVFGDWTGHARDHTNLKSNYDVIREMCGTMPGFSQKVQPGDIAPPGNRLIATNQLFWDLRSGTGRRWLKIAPRCVNGLREFAVMPMKSGTMEKDKSDRVQRQLGLSHLGDALENWVWKRFPKGPQPKASPGVSLVGKRESGESGWSVGKRVTGAGPTPWRADREEYGKW